MNRGAVAALMVLSALTLAPTPGDIGGCGQPTEDLDPAIFFGSLEATDCAACSRCGFATKSCEVACAGEPGLEPRFPEGCLPLAHDGEVCLRRLQSASCDEFRPMMVDAEGGSYTPMVDRPRPTECQFCPPRGP